ncbi:MAG: DUF2339 domain-containing protein [Azoarcus sp.]|jgi:uncharacterized membrane protein|nr:DUF2339 domain-containing protein [Azoarcus sp.]
MGYLLLLAFSIAGVVILWLRVGLLKGRYSSLRQQMQDVHAQIQSLHEQIAALKITALIQERESGAKAEGPSAASVSLLWQQMQALREQITALKQASGNEVEQPPPASATSRRQDQRQDASASVAPPPLPEVGKTPPGQDDALLTLLDFPAPSAASPASSSAPEFTPEFTPPAEKPTPALELSSVPEPAPVPVPEKPVEFILESTSAREKSPIPAQAEIMPVARVEEKLAPREGEALGKARIPPPVRPPEPTLFDAVWGWLSRGNPVLRIGALILFIGLAFLLRYAYEQYSLPVELRYIGVTAAAIILLGLGWRLRKKRPAYGLMLQGTGIAVLYLTSFTAMHLHHLLRSEEVGVLLVLFTVFAVVLAVMQDALELACVAVLGGFAAPILASSGSGEHVPLFMYFACLNCGIALIAWFKAWRVLNLIGFLGTFGIGFTWGIRSWHPGLFSTTEPFLVLFFLMYVIIGLLFARRKLMEGENAPEGKGRRAMLKWSAGNTDYVDGTLMFGPPLIGFGLQCALIKHIEFGMAYSALALGILYMLMASFMRERPRVGLLMEIYLALGMIFATLAIPLAFDAQWTSAAWAVEGAGIYWLSFRQRRRLARAFSLTLIAAAAGCYLNGIELGMDTLLDAEPLGALLLGAALLFCHRALRRAPDKAVTHLDRPCLPVFAISGLSFLYLIPPSCFALNATVISWALAGVLTLFAGIPLRSRPFLTPAFGIQLLGGVLFLSNLHTSGYGSVLASGWQGVASASLIGFALIASAIIARGDAMARKNQALAHRLGLALLAGLVFVNLAVLFVFEWNEASIAWAGSGLLIIWLGLWQRQQGVFYFGLALEAIAGLAFIGGGMHLPAGPFWPPAALALAALAGAWRLQQFARRELEPSSEPKSRRESKRRAASSEPFIDTAPLSGLLLAWGIGWWVWADASLVDHYIIGLDDNAPDEPLRSHLMLIMLSASALLWMAIARLAQWRGLALASLLPILAAWKVLAMQGMMLDSFGGVSWGMFLLVHFVVLRALSGLLPAQMERGAHVAGCWTLIGVLALAARNGVGDVLNVDPRHSDSAWIWLAMALPPSLYLLLTSGERGRFWPLKAFPREYRLTVAAPMMCAMLLWFWAANFTSGIASPLPYLPFVNPLELALLLVLMTCWRWSRARLPELGFSPRFVARAPTVVTGMSLLALVSMIVCRAAHHWSGVPFRPDSLLGSMGVQAGWSLVWSLFALTLMISGNLRGDRFRWMAGASLIGIVVVKLFFVELGGHGGLARVVSFIGVGVLLLIVGYFSPLPPRRENEERNR